MDSNELSPVDKHREAVKKWNNEHLVAVNFRVRPEIRDDFRYIAEILNLGYAELFRIMIKDFIARYGNKEADELKQAVHASLNKDNNRKVDND